MLKGRVLTKKELDNMYEYIIKGWIFEINDRILEDNRDLTITGKVERDNKTNNRYKYKYYTYHCNICGYNGYKLEGSLINRKFDKVNCNNIIIGNSGGCPCCNNTICVKGINDMATTSPWMIEYLVNKEDGYKFTRSSQKYIDVKCPECGTIKPKQIKVNTLHSNNSIGCNCSDGMSFIEKYILNILIQLKIEYKQEHRFETWDKYYNKFKDKYSFALYDFVLPKYKIIIEADGGFHRADNTKTGQTKEESIWIDEQKNELAEQHNYKVIRITDEGDIKQNILKSKLSKLFDLSKVDWLQCGQFALSNFDRVICERWNNKSENETTKDLAWEFGRSQMGIVKILNKGSKYKWCDYDGKKELKKHYIRRSNRVAVYKDNILIGIFDSYSQLERESLNVLGVKLYASAICRYIKKEDYRGYRGYTFKLL